jgi:hypothetical protein
MKRPGLIVVTLFTLLLTGFLLPPCSWFSPRSLRASPRASEPLAHARVQDPFATQAAWRWRQCQPNHWRACMLQH